MSGARTPLGNYPSVGELRRPASRTGIRTSLTGNFAASTNGHGHAHGHGHGHSSSISGPIDEGLATPRRSTFGKSVSAADQAALGSGIPAPAGLPRRKSGGVGALLSDRRQSAGGSFSSDGGGSGSGSGHGDMGPPGPGRRKLSEVGETF